MMLAFYLGKKRIYDADGGGGVEGYSLLYNQTGTRYLTAVF